MTELQTKLEEFQEKFDLVITQWLCVEFPNLFDIKNPKPLAKGIGAMLQKQLPERINVTTFKMAMSNYCQKKRYLKAMIKGTHRYDLNGEPVAEITPEDKIRAKEHLEKIKERQAAKAAEKNSVKENVEEVRIAEEPIAIVETPIESEPVIDVKPKATLSLKSKKSEEISTPMTNTTEEMALAKGLKVTLVIDPASLPKIDTTGMKKAPVTIFISNGELKATTEINAKSYRKALSSIEEYGVEGCNVIIQGAMKQYGVIDDAGLVVQPKKQANAE